LFFTSGRSELASRLLDETLCCRSFASCAFSNPVGCLTPKTRSTEGRSHKREGRRGRQSRGCVCAFIGAGRPRRKEGIEKKGLDARGWRRGAVISQARGGSQSHRTGTVEGGRRRESVRRARLGNKGRARARRRERGGGRRGMGVGLLIRSLPFPSLSTSTGSGPSPMIQSNPFPVPPTNSPVFTRRARGGRRRGLPGRPAGGRTNV
jgi:hypothetical protein